MCLAKICRISVLLAVAVLAVGCSTSSDQGARRLAGPEEAPRRVQRVDAAPQLVARRDNPAQTYRAPPPAAKTNCSLEPLRARPASGQVVVEQGDNLCRIAKRYETTVQAIVDENRLSSPMLAVGMRLRLPSAQYYATSPFGQLRRR